MSEHTPGPWRLEIDEPKSGVATSILAQDGVLVVAGEYDGYMAPFACRPAEEAIANARLIAAAPDLLEALKLCMDAMFPGSPDADWETAYEKAKAAIAKAEAANG